MKNASIRRVLAIILFCFTLGAMLLYAAAAVFSGIFGVRAMVLSCAVVGLPAALGAWLYAGTLETPEQKRRTVRGVEIGLFVYYCIVLAGLLFISRAWFSSAITLTQKEYFEMYTNFEPFSTVRRYLPHAVDAGRRYFYVAFVNLVGNLVAFMPMGAFLPCLSRRLNRFYLIFPLLLSMLILVELLQLWLRVGTCDVDDVILNLIGALIAYGIVEIKPLKKLLQRLYLMPA